MKPACLYRETLETFGFGYIMQATVLTNSYPFDKFLLMGQPHIDLKTIAGNTQKYVSDWISAITRDGQTVDRVRSS